MRRSDFAYELPNDLIAQRPPAERSGGRLLHVKPAGVPLDLEFSRFPSLLRRGDLLIFNDTRVIPARVIGVKPTGGQVEILLERIVGARTIIAHVGTSKPLRADVPVVLPGGVEARLVARHDDLFELTLTADPLEFFQQLRFDAAATLHRTQPPMHRMPSVIRLCMRWPGRGSCAHRGIAFRRGDARALCAVGSRHRRTSRCTWAPVRFSRSVSMISASIGCMPSGSS